MNVLANVRILSAAMKQPPPTDPDTTPRANAALISLVRNSELEGIISSMRYMEKSFNSKFNYPWVFFNDVEFTQEFKDKTQAETNAPCTYGQLVWWSDY